MSLLQRLFGGLGTTTASFDDDLDAACCEVQYRVKKALKKMPREEARAVIRGEIIRLGLRDATAVAIYNKAHPQEAT